MVHFSPSSAAVMAVSLITSTAVLVSGQSIHLTLPTNPPQTLSETITRTFTDDLPPFSNDIPSQTTVTTCPTILSLTEVCSECVTIACIAPLTVTAPCGCPDQPVTKYDAHPCGMGCAGLEGCQTETTVVTPTDCPSSGSGGPSSTGSGGSSSSDLSTTTTTGTSETGVSSTEPSETQSTETTVIVTTTDTDTPSAPVSTLPPTSRSSTAAAARLTPFRLW
ncbi:hypothetical protein QBC37DRAFT_431821 [Rhypophila decipiens]|uniref:Uncharacterized protein n=1 Tax=Rhypophila decipiens TaxID=261697 RepID=A0AAN6XXP3_9PEZI|nr:hypothetical protein QBC37DRAFT_431821 [Rhypophila decipiens]